VFQAHYNAPLFVPCPLVLVMHDISFALMPGLFPFIKGRQAALRAHSAVRKARRVVVGSLAIRRSAKNASALGMKMMLVVSRASRRSSCWWRSVRRCRS